MEKPTADAIAALDAAFPTDPRASRKLMFGTNAGIIGGHFFAGVYEGGVSLRLGKTRVQALIEAHPGVAPFQPGGRTWPEYALVDGTTWKGTPELSGWVREALDYTATMPAKTPKPKKA